MIPVLLTLLALSAAAHAQGRDARHLLRFGAGLVGGTGEGQSSFVQEPADPLNGVRLSGTTTIRTDVTPALWVGYEHRFNSRLGLGINFEYTSLTLEFEEFRSVETILGGVIDGTGEGTIVAEGSMNTVPVTLELPIYLKSTDRWQLFFAPIVGYTFYDNMESEDWSLLIVIEPSGTFFPITEQFNSKVDNSASFGARFGFDFELSDDRMVLATSLGYLKMAAETTDGDLTLDVDPIVLRIGLATRF